MSIFLSLSERFTDALETFDPLRGEWLLRIADPWPRARGGGKLAWARLSAVTLTLIAPVWLFSAVPSSTFGGNLALLSKLAVNRRNLARNLLKTRGLSSRDEMRPLPSLAAVQITSRAGYRTPCRIEPRKAASMAGFAFRNESRRRFSQPTPIRAAFLALIPIARRILGDLINELIRRRTRWHYFRKLSS
jgi:hypothetical protein